MRQIFSLIMQSYISDYLMTDIGAPKTSQKIPTPPSQVSYSAHFLRARQMRFLPIDFWADS
jgi:hypothetical protein